MTGNHHAAVKPFRVPASRLAGLINWNLQLQAQAEALEEDNKQLRAAVSIYSEVARRSPASLTGARRVA